MLGKSLRLVSFALAAVVGVGAFSACGSPCRELADHICDCQPTRAKRESCKRSVSSADGNIDPSDEQESTCQSILDSGRCTCQALAAGEFSACGLAANPLD